MSSSPNIIESANLSHAWRSALDLTANSPNMEITPLIVTLTDFQECTRMRDIIDTHLTDNNLATIQTVSETIFPETLYLLFDKDRFQLYDEYLKNLPRLKKIAPKSNGRGTYFERLIAYEASNNSKINQLEIIINSLQDSKVKRRSKLQASIFDPSKDHTNGMFQGFPCLQHVTCYKSASGGLVLNSFYAIQYLYQRGYGNWLGLINLGRFLANELDMELERFNCFIGVEQLDHLSKTQAKKLLKVIA